MVISQQITKQISSYYIFQDIKPRLNCLEKMYQELDYILEDCVFYISKESKKSL